MPFGVTFTFAGFRSRWMTPFSCAASSASAICRAIGNASSIAITPCADPVRERLALDQLHHECTDAVCLFETIDLRDIGMIQCSQCLRLALEARQALGVMGKGFRQNLDGDVAPKVGIEGAIDFTHPALTDLGGDLERAEPGASD